MAVYLSILGRQCYIYCLKISGISPQPCTAAEDPALPLATDHYTQTNECALTPVSTTKNYKKIVQTSSQIV
jgi:hypothetical protein